MKRLLITWLCLAAIPHAFPRVVAEKMKEMYLNFERGAAVGGDMPKKLEESKSRKRRRKRDEQEDLDTGEWGSMGKALAGGLHLQKLLKPLDIRESQQMYHTSHENEHSLEGVVVSLLCLCQIHPDLSCINLWESSTL